MEEDEPVMIKKLGKLIADFDDEKWAAIKSDIMYQGIEAKFRQNPALHNMLLSTNDWPIVEYNQPYQLCHEQLDNLSRIVDNLLLTV